MSLVEVMAGDVNALLHCGKARRLRAGSATASRRIMAKRARSSIPPYKRKRPRSWSGADRLAGQARPDPASSVSVLWVLAYRFINPPITATMLGDVFAGRGATRDWMPIEQIDRDMVRAAIAAEDSKFCQHNGFDFEAIENAMKRNASGGRIRGGSTISQQTAKNAFLWQGGGYARKGVEAWFTFLIENDVGASGGSWRSISTSPRPASAPMASTPARSAISAMTRAR